MQLAKHNWKKSRNNDRFTRPNHDGSYNTRRGRRLSGIQHEQQMLSRLCNPQDPINRN